MNSLRRAVALIVRSQSTSKRVIFYSAGHVTQPYSTQANKSINAVATTTTKRKAADWPKPSEIPFQVKVANSVNLIGHVDAPVQFQTSSDGKHWAGTVIVQQASPHSPLLWIPILFEGDLAHIAASHLKKDDHIHIAGQLTADPPAVDGIGEQANVQVMVQSLNFVESASKINKVIARKQQAAITDHPAKSYSTNTNDDSASSLWRDLLDNPERWRDYRSDKLKGLVKPRYPDFKHKDNRSSLWLNGAPSWVLSELEGVVLDAQTPKSHNACDDHTESMNSFDVPIHKSADDFWKDLVNNPHKWWDNRLEKKSVRGPDFRHKTTGKGLWLVDSPDWVISQLPPAKKEGKVASDKKETLLS